MFDVFISYAHEDKEFAEELLSALTTFGLKVWYDELQLEVGDSISNKLGQAINQSNFGVLIISNHYLSKQWTTAEMRLFFQLQLADKQKKILPIWHGVEIELIREKFSFLMDVKALRTNIFGVEKIASAIYKVARGVEPPVKPTARETVQEKETKTKNKGITEKDADSQDVLPSKKSLNRTNFKKTLRRTV